MPGAPSLSGSAAGSVEIVCDESGAEGERLVRANTDVFAHASIRLTIEEGADCLAELRERIRSPAIEYKALHLQRTKNRQALLWLLGRTGPLFGSAQVYLVDKEFYIVGHLVSVLYETIDAQALGFHLPLSEETRRMARILYQGGESAFGSEKWFTFLEAFNDLMRARRRTNVSDALDPFVAALETLALGHRGGRVGEIMEQLSERAPYGCLIFRREPPYGLEPLVTLDPLLPAIVRAVEYWGTGSTGVSVIHDKHVSLTTERVARLQRVCAAFAPGKLTSLRKVDSRSDTRIQLADILAGVARAAASDELNSRGDVELTALMQPYVDPFSVWGDDRSWSRLSTTVS